MFFREIVVPFWPLFAAGAALVLYGMSIWLVKLTGRERVLMGLVSVFLLGLLGLIGNNLLEIFGVSLRFVPMLGLAVVFAVSGLMMFLVWIEGAAGRQKSRVLCWGIRGGGTALCAASTALIAAVLILLSLVGAERVVEYQGQRLVGKDFDIVDDDCYYYAYYGPLFRGAEALISSDQPIQAR